MIGETKQKAGPKPPKSYIEELFQQGTADEFVVPTLFREDLAIQANDSVIFFNFSEDSQRQLARMFVDPEAGGKPNYEIGETETKTHSIPENLYLASLVEYESVLGIPAAFPAERVVNPLGKVLSDAGKVQLRLAETQKYAYVTTLFNGMAQKPFPNEYRVLIPSRAEAKIDEYPKMRVKDVADRVIAALGDGVYDFILADFSNADLLAHTGNIDATMKGILAIDEQVGRVTKAVLSAESTMVITSSHGNAEVMLDLRTGLIERADNKSPVPIYIVAPGYERQKSEEQANAIDKVNSGVLSDVAPTVLEIMGLPQPEDMTGISLLRMLS